MSETIKDGTGTGNLAKVGTNNRLWTFSISESITEAAAILGDSYNFNTGTITLTSGNKSGLAYLKNNGEEEIAIVSIGFLSGASAGGTGDLLAEVEFNPTGGTVISGATNSEIFINKNAGSSKTLSVDSYKGAEGLTFTGGATAYFSLIKATGVYVINTGSIVLPKGSSVGISFTPQSGNTSMDIQVFMSIIELNF